MKKLKYVAQMLCPLAIMLGLQVAVTFVLMFGWFFYAAFSDRLSTDTLSGDAMINELVSSSSFNTIFMFVVEVSMIIGFGIFFYSKYGKSEKNPVNKLSAATLPGILLIFVGAEMVTSCILIGTEKVFPKLMQAYGEMMEQMVGDLSFGILFVSIILAPIAEEIVFRGLTLRYAMKITKSFWLANLFQAILFGVAHLNLVQGLYACLLGCVLGFIRKRYDSIFASMLGHIIYNFSGTVLVGIVFGFEVENELLYILSVAFISLVLIAGGIMIVLKDEKSIEGNNRYMLKHELIYANANNITELKIGE